MLDELVVAEGRNRGDARVGCGVMVPAGDQWWLLVLQMMPAQPPIQPRLPSLLSRALVALGLQEQRPALNLLPLLLTSLLHTRPSQQDPD